MSKQARITDAARGAGLTRAKPELAPKHTRRPDCSYHTSDDHPRLAQRALGNEGLGRLLAAVNVQAKLRVSQANDASEREADRVAALILGMQIPENGDVAPPRITRCPAARQNKVDFDNPLPGGEERAAIERRLGLLQGAGRPLPAPLREFFEQRFGADLGNVRIHTDCQAVDTARALGARAFTHGTHIAFDRGEYAPGSVSGKRLLAHEIVHTRQHQLPGSATPRSLNVVQRRKTPPESGPDASSRAAAERLPDYLATRDIQWHIDPMEILKAHSAAQLYLLISVRRIASREIVSAPKIAAAAVDILLGNTTLDLNDNQYQAFVSYVTAKLNTRGFETAEFFIAGVSEDAIEKFFKPASYRQITGKARDDWSGEDEIQTRLADGDYLDFERIEAEGREKARRLEAWAESKEKKIRRMIDKARNQKPRPLDLPDKVSARKGKKRWHLRVWVDYDLQKRTKNRASGLVRLRTNESDAALFARVRAATARAMILEEYAEKTKREKEFPQWAKDKKKAIEEELVRQRHEPGNRHKKTSRTGWSWWPRSRLAARSPKPTRTPRARHPNLAMRCTSVPKRRSTRARPEPRNLSQLRKLQWAYPRTRACRLLHISTSTCGLSEGQARRTSAREAMSLSLSPHRRTSTR